MYELLEECARKSRRDFISRLRILTAFIIWIATAGVLTRQGLIDTITAVVIVAIFGLLINYVYASWSIIDEDGRKIAAITPASRIDVDMISDEVVIDNILEMKKVPLEVPDVFIDNSYKLIILKNINAETELGYLRDVAKAVGEESLSEIKEYTKNALIFTLISAIIYLAFEYTLGIGEIIIALLLIIYILIAFVFIGMIAYSIVDVNRGETIGYLFVIPPLTRLNKRTIKKYGDKKSNHDSKEHEDNLCLLNSSFY